MKVLKRIPADKDARRLALVGGLVLVLLGLQPWLWNQVFDAAANFRDRQTQQQQLANVERLTGLIKSVDSNQQALLDQAAVAFPPSDAAPLIVERLESLAEAQGLTLQLTSLIDEPKDKKKEELTPFEVSLTVVGSPRSLLTFFDSVEHMQELTQVQVWKMEVMSGPVAGSKLYSLSLTVRLFLQPPA